MVKLTIKILIIILPVLAVFGTWEYFCRKFNHDNYCPEDYFSTHDKFTVYPRLIHNSDTIILGNSISRGGINPVFVNNNLSLKRNIYNLSSLGIVGSGHVLAQFDYLDTLDIKDKTLVIYLDARQWTEEKPSLAHVKKIVRKQSEDNDRIRFICFEDDARLTPINLTHLFKAAYYGLTNNREAMIIELFKFKFFMVGQLNLKFNYETGWLGSLTKPNFDISYDELMKYIHPILVEKPYAKGTDAQKRFHNNLQLLKQTIERYEKNNNRIVLLRLPQDRKLIDHENREFPELNAFFEESGLPHVDLTHLNLPLLDGAHPSVNESLIISKEFANEIEPLLK
jgi:hypothetical protein